MQLTGQLSPFITCYVDLPAAERPVTLLWLPVSSTLPTRTFLFTRTKHANTKTPWPLSQRTQTEGEIWGYWDYVDVINFWFVTRCGMKLRTAQAFLGNMLSQPVIHLHWKLGQQILATHPNQ